MMNADGAVGGGVAGGIDPRVELISQRLQQLQQMAAASGPDQGHGHSHGGGQQCDGPGHEHNPVMMQQLLQRMQGFIEKQAEGVDAAAAGPENQAKARQAMEMIQRLQGGVGAAIPMPGGAGAAGHTGLEGLPVAGAAQHVESTDPDGEDKRKVALMAGDLAANAPHRQDNWVKYPKGISDGPMESALHGGGHFTPPVFGWGELVKETDPAKDKIIKKTVAKPQIFNGPMGIPMPHETDSSGSIIYKTLPIFGRIRFLTDLQGLFFWSIVVVYWIMGNYSTWFCILIPQYNDGNLSCAWLIVYGIISALCITSHLRASTTNPGKVPYYVSEDSIDHPDWSYCHQCDQKRPPRAHHCRRCKQCVLKMDHHCPWINNCVGEENQWSFILLVTYAQLLSCFTLAFNILWYKFMPPCKSCDPNSFAIFHQKFFITTLSAMAVLMIIFSMGLICSQNMSVMLDYTTLEWMQLEREVTTTGRMPVSSEMPKMKGYCYSNYRQLCGQTMCIFWPFPCRRRVAPVLKHIQDV